MIRMLGRVRPAYRHLAPDIQRNIASLIWQASNKRREHSGYDGAFFFTYQELDQKFGRAQFLTLNSELELFDVLPYDCKAQRTPRLQAEAGHSKSPAQHAEADLGSRASSASSA
jgi:hypothetical protein